jgi:hypothetical protein
MAQQLDAKSLSTFKHQNKPWLTVAELRYRSVNSIKLPVEASLWNCRSDCRMLPVSQFSVADLIDKSH